DVGGRRLGSYSSYVKVARPFWKARLGLDKRVYAPGDLVLSRPENYGTKLMTYGEGFTVQRWAQGGWSPAPKLQPDGVLLWLGLSGPGAPGRCSPLGLPEGVERGWYRLVKSVSEPLRGDRSRLHRLTASFFVK
ncbi:MAG TPA: hypothetical protein VFZ29_00330, partial [Solirubrobacterales bacterium]